MKKTIPFSKSQIEEIIQQYPTPFHIYDEQAIIDNAKNLSKAFNWIKGYSNYFAVKANPNPHLIKILKKEGMGVDCSSLPELILAERLGFKGNEIMFTSNDTPYEEFKIAYDLGAIINLDDISHIEVLEKYAGIPDKICFRFNPGSLRINKGNIIIGKPEEAKYGMTQNQLFEGYKIMKTKRVKRFGLHKICRNVI
jgi:diaminopimelate decarboxylase